MSLAVLSNTVVKAQSVIKRFYINFFEGGLLCLTNCFI